MVRLLRRGGGGDAAISAYEALDTVIVRGLASAKFEAMDRVATAAAPQ